MGSNRIDEIKETMRLKMIENFENDGFISPVLFFLENNEILISMIPFEFLGSPEGKMELAEFIKNVCGRSTVLAAGIIIEANAAKLIPDTEMSKLVLNGDIKISELKEKQSIILMQFSTPVSEEMFAYAVDEKNKTVGDTIFNSGDADNAQGIFSNFFTWNRN